MVNKLTVKRKMKTRWYRSKGKTTSSNMYYCPSCKSYHQKSSKMGKSHWVKKQGGK